jgi:hypothetical protein
MPDSPPPETLAWLRHAASCGQRDAQLTLHILERLEALEAPQRQPHQDKLDRLIEQDRGDDDDLRTLHGIALDMVKTLPILPEIKRTLYQAIREPMEQPTPEVAPVATDKELCRAFNSTSEYGFEPALRAVYNLDRQHGAAQPPAAQPTPVAAGCSALDARVWAYIGTQAMRGDPAAAVLIDLLNEPSAPQPAPPAAPVAVDARDPECVERWPDCHSEGYDSRCCRFPKSCSCGGEPPAPQPAPPAAPAGGLVARVEARAGGDGRAAIREVAAWLRELRPRKKDCYHAALSLEQETDQ